MTAAASSTGVTWLIAEYQHLCHECVELIQPGEKIALWDEVTVNSRSSWGSDCSHLHFPRHYCEPCGHLLEDSLTTTEAL